jgi:hypothetical protein
MKVRCSQTETAQKPIRMRDQLIACRQQKRPAPSIHPNIPIPDHTRPSFAIGCDEIAKGVLAHRRGFSALRHQPRTKGFAGE